MVTLDPNRRIYLIGGPGGVGKTTLAAGLGARFAQLGKRTLVLTVDPARRLAQALGFQNGFPDEVQAVPLADQWGGSLHATQLDVQRYFDRIIMRFAKSERQRDNILANPLYQLMVESMGGTHEYAAMERLLEFSQLAQYEKIIVDTPPSQNAVDLLAAPERLAEFMDNGVIKWFQSGTKIPFFRQGTKVALRVIQTLFGAPFMESLNTFFDEMDGMQSGFRERHREVQRLIRSEQTAFLLVSYASETRFLETQAFLQNLQSQGLALAGVVLNRMDPEPLVLAPPSASEAFAQCQIFYRKRREVQIHWCEKFKQLAPQLPLLTVPQLATPANDIPQLAGLGERLIQ